VHVGVEHVNETTPVRRFVGTAVALLLVWGSASACARGDGPAMTPVAVTLEGATMGTTYHVKVVAESADASTRIVTLQGDIDAALERVNAQMSTYQDDSELSRFNARASTEPFAASAPLVAVTRRALEIGSFTEGAFDVTLAPLIALWGFDKDGPRAEPPSVEEVAAARARAGLDKLTVDVAHLKKAHPDLSVNLSGIAKGYGVDVVSELLVAKGFTRFMVEIGGEVRTRGMNADGVPWRIGINVPRPDAAPEAVFRAVVLDGRAMATSGSYRNFFESGGRRYSHILDPRTASPVETSVISASIVAEDCMTADGLATAAMILDSDALARALARVPGASALRIVEETVEGTTRHRTEIVGTFPPMLDE